jgi:hypothetical protein
MASRGIALALVLIAAQAHAEEDRPHIALAAGSGVAFGGSAGLHAEVLYRHFAAFFGVGADLNLGELPCFAAGARAFLGDRQGLFVSGAAAWITVNKPGDLFTAEFADAADLFISATAGYRALHHSGFFLDLALGAAWLRERRSGFEPAGFNSFCAATSQAYSCQKIEWRPDVNVAVGFDF